MANRRQELVPRVANAPAPVLTPGTPLPPNRVESVVLGDGDDVEWIWTSEPGGASFVSGYRIIRRRRGRRGSGGRMTWKETYRDMSRAKEDWSDLDSIVADGLQSSKEAAA